MVPLGPSEKELAMKKSDVKAGGVYAAKVTGKVEFRDRGRLGKYINILLEEQA